MKKIVGFLLLIFIALSGLVAYQYLHFYDGKLHVIFCDVGQGDGILVITPNNKHIIIDGGPDDSILTCLSRHMPFWERDIDLMILTHPHADHFFGMFGIVNRYHVKAFATEDLVNKTQSYQELLKLLEDKKIPRQEVGAGDTWNVGDVRLAVVGPTQAYLHSTSPGGTIGESKEFASLLTLLSFGSFTALFTGDSQDSGIVDAQDSIGETLSVLHVPHHGSATGLTTQVIKSLAPQVAVISVGANNYGHPNKKILELFKTHNVPVRQTATEGDVEIVSDGADL